MTFGTDSPRDNRRPFCRGLEPSIYHRDGNQCGLRREQKPRHADRHTDEFDGRGRSDIDGAKIDLRKPEVEVDVNQAGALWTPEVANDSGQDLSDAVLAVSANHVEDCAQQPLAVSDYPNECDASEDEDPGTAREAAAEDRDYIEASGEKSTWYGARATCAKDVPVGDHEFTLSLELPEYEGAQDLSDVAAYPDLALHARLIVDGGVVAATSSQVTVTVDPALHRVEFQDLPSTLSRDDETVHDRRFTLTNNTDQALEDATVSIEIAGDHELLELTTGNESCREEEHEETSEELECDVETVAAGDSLSMEFGLNATGVDSDWPTRVKIHVSHPDPAPDNPDRRDTFAAGADRARPAQRSRRCWRDSRW